MVYKEQFRYTYEGPGDTEKLRRRMIHRLVDNIPLEEMPFFKFKVWDKREIAPGELSLLSDEERIKLELLSQQRQGEVELSCAVPSREPQKQKGWVALKPRNPITGK